MEKQKYYITTAIAYTSGKPHIGNTYEAVLADAIARYKRLEGYDVFVLQTKTTRNRFRRSSKKCMQRAIFTRDIMRECTVLPVSPFLQRASL